MEKLEIIIRGENGKRIVIARAQGDIDLPGSNHLSRELANLEKTGDYHILVDLENVEFICSSGLGVLIVALRNLKRFNGTLKLLHLRNGVLEKFRITKLIGEFEVFESEEDALKSFKPGQ